MADDVKVAQVAQVAQARDAVQERGAVTEGRRARGRYAVREMRPADQLWTRNSAASNGSGVALPFSLSPPPLSPLPPGASAA